MSRVDFERDDLAVQVRRLPNGDARLRTSFATKSREVVVRAPTVLRWWEKRPFQIPDFPPATVVAAWKKRRAPRTPSARFLQRVTIDIADPEFVGLGWEQALDFGVPVVRVCSVRPHAETIAFTLPLRIVQISPAAGFSLPKLVYGLFVRTTQEKIHAAVEVQAVPSLPSLGRSVVAAKPTLDVLHFSSWREFGSRQDRLSFADASAQGTVAWLARRCSQWQTRLVVFRCDRPSDFDQALHIAFALVSVGGPAVVVDCIKLDRAQAFYRSFYSDLIHDFPLDEALNRATSPQVAPRSETSPFVSLFAGAGREEGLRVSSIGLKMLEIAKSVSRRRLPGTSKELNAVLSRGSLQTPRVLSLRRANAFAKEFKSINQKWNSYQFEFHEHDGLIPLAGHLKNVRSIIHSHPVLRRPLVIQDFAVPKLSHGGVKSPLPKITSKEGFFTGKKPAVRVVPQKPAAHRPSAESARYVNSGFWQEDSKGLLKEMKQEGACLVEGQTYHLGVDIGARNARIVVSDATAVLEEVFRWTPEMQGEWVEVGVTGIDFEVVGSSVRELWLPRIGPSERIYFMVLPKSHGGVARLRLCLYHNQQIVQSFRMVAVISTGENMEVAASKRQTLLSSALGLPADSVGRVGFLARLEYSVGSVNHIAERGSDRSGSQISIVANEWNKDTVITVKGAGLQDVNIVADNDVGTYVRNIRVALEEASTQTFKDGDQAYRFGNSDGPNATNREKLSERIPDIALRGWQLFDKLLPENQRDELGRLLAARETNIRVAHTLREKVIPWGVLYDRMYDPNKVKDATGNPVAFDFCPAGMPDPQGNQRTSECFKSTDCILHGYPEKPVKNSEGKTLLPETVVCPVHFWGFHHVIEVPPQQVEPGGDGRTMPDQIKVSGKVQMTVGANCKLALQQEHMDELKTLAGTCKVAWTEPSYDRDQIIERLKQKDLSIVYFYCHALGGEGSTVKIPELHFQGPEDKKPGIITPDGLAYGFKWQCSPLVFLNGCGTVGYTPDALSPFLKKLVDDRGASGVIGTEIPVWEQLAGEMARRFLKAFLGNKCAGQALLEARRALLAQNNPLGLVYTLYAPSKLEIAFTN